MTTKWPALAMHSERTSSKHTELHDWQSLGCKVQWTPAVMLISSVWIVNYGQRRDKFNWARKQISTIMAASGFCKVIHSTGIWGGQNFRILSDPIQNIRKLVNSTLPDYCVETRLTYLPHLVKSFYSPAQCLTARAKGNKRLMHQLSNKKLKMSLSTLWRHTDISALTLKFGTRCIWVANFMLRPLYLRGNKAVAHWMD
jgi:hypothetical protein